MRRLHSKITPAARRLLLVPLLLGTSGCSPISITLDTRTLAWSLLLCATVAVIQFGVITLMLVRNPRLRRHLRRWGLVEPQLEKTRHQLYAEIARHEATEELLQETQEYLQRIINSIPSVLIGVTADGFITHWNAAAEKATGLTAAQVLGAHLDHAYSDLAVDMAVIQRVVASGTPDVRENMQRGHGAQTRFIDIRVCPLISSEISGAVILADDVTTRVRLESMMIQNEKMMSLGELAAGLAHEINNPLAGILNNVQNVLRRTSAELHANRQTAEEVGIQLEQLKAYLDKRQVLDFIENIGESGERAAHIVKNMLEFSRGQDYLHHTGIDLVELVRHSLELANTTFELETGVGIERPVIEEDYEQNLPMLTCSPTEIQQVILNLLRNAAQAFQMTDYGPPLNPKIVLRVMRDGDYIRVEVEDNGPGMPESVMRHIFEPFFTTKEVGQGTGLGLSVSYFIITEHHQGRIEVNSRPGDGTTFIIHLPLSRPAAIVTEGADNHR